MDKTGQRKEGKKMFYYGSKKKTAKSQNWHLLRCENEVLSNIFNNVISRRAENNTTKQTADWYWTAK